jgi:hypothetical protein
MDNNSCPVKFFLEKYLLWANISLNSDEFIFRNLTKCKDRFELLKENVPISYTRTRELFIDAFRPFVSDVKKYGLHSLRSGGVTTAANLGISDRLQKTDTLKIH